MWYNVTGQTSTREENLAALATGAGLHRRRTYNDRIVSTFDDGFVVQYTTEVVTHNGKKRRAVGVPGRRGARRHDHEALRVPRLGEVRSPGVSVDERVRDPRTCEAFFDAYENRRVDVLDRLYSDDCIIWHNVFGRETTHDENGRDCPRATRASAAAPTTTASSTRFTTAS